MDIREYENSVKHGFSRNERNGVLFYTADDISATQKFIHGFTARLGGVSSGEFATLNLSKTREANQENKAENFRRVAAAIGFDPASMALVNYEHGDGIEVLKAADAGQGFTRENGLAKCDGLIVTEEGVTAVTMHADCVPFFAVDPVKRVAGVCHAGWKGVMKRLPQKIVQSLLRDFESSKDDLIVAVGPHIMSCCFEVGGDVAALFSSEFGEDVVNCGPEKPHVDLQRAILLQMAEEGVAPGQVTVSDLCTYCHDELFYSHRRDKGRTGAMGAFMALRHESDA